MFEHLKEVGWAFFLILLFLIGMIALFGRTLGFESVSWICLGFALIIAAIFLMIILSELLLVGMIRLIKQFLSRY